MLMSVFNLCNHRPLMKKKLEQGTTLVVDRYSFSGVAFTSAKSVSVRACVCACQQAGVLLTFICLSPAGVLNGLVQAPRGGTS